MTDIEQVIDFIHKLIGFRSNIVHMEMCILRMGERKLLAQNHFILTSYLLFICDIADTSLCSASKCLFPVARKLFWHHSFGDFQTVTVRRGAGIRFIYVFISRTCPEDYVLTNLLQERLVTDNNSTPDWNYQWERTSTVNNQIKKYGNLIGEPFGRRILMLNMVESPP